MRLAGIVISLAMLIGDSEASDSRSVREINSGNEEVVRQLEE